MKTCKKIIAVALVLMLAMAGMAPHCGGLSDQGHQRDLPLGRRRRHGLLPARVLYGAGEAAGPDRDR